MRKALPWFCLALSACGAPISIGKADAQVITATDAGTVVTDAGQTPVTDAGSPVDAGTLGPIVCVARPVPDDATSVAHTTHPLVYGVAGSLTVVKDSTLANPEWPGHPITVYRPSGTAAYPVLFYSHAFGGTDPTHVEAMLNRLASNGFNIVFVPYQSNDRLQQYKQLWVGFTTAVASYGAKFDLTHVGFFGHSFGGGATPEMARRAFGAPTDNGLGTAWGSAGRFMFIMAPWYSYPNIANPTVGNDDFHQLPDDVKTVIQLYADDDINDHRIALNDIWAKLPSTLTDKGFQMVPSDACGSEALNAGHTTPATYNDGTGSSGGPGTGNNDHDEWATARRIHALAAYAFEGSLAGKALAYPKTTDELSLGNWSGVCADRPVMPLQASTTGLITTTCGGKGTGNYVFTYSATGHCSNSVTGSGGSPPCR